MDFSREGFGFGRSPAATELVSGGRSPSCEGRGLPHALTAPRHHGPARPVHTPAPAHPHAPRPQASAGCTAVGRRWPPWSGACPAARAEPGGRPRASPVRGGMKVLRFFSGTKRMSGGRAGAEMEEAGRPGPRPSPRPQVPRTHGSARAASLPHARVQDPCHPAQDTVARCLHAPSRQMALPRPQRSPQP